MIPLVMQVLAAMVPKSKEIASRHAVNIMELSMKVSVILQVHHTANVAGPSKCKCHHVHVLLPPAGSLCVAFHQWLTLR